jgi:hypothetical protein
MLSGRFKFWRNELVLVTDNSCGTRSGVYGIKQIHVPSEGGNMNWKHKAAGIFLAQLALALLASRGVCARPADDVCSLLPPSELQKSLGEIFGPPKASTAPPAFPGQAAGTNCRYKAQNGRHTAVFIVYTDSSAAEAKQTFEKVSAWFGTKSKPSLGDAAYIDARNAIHVLKGKTRYFIEIDRANEKQLLEVAASVSARL